MYRYKPYIPERAIEYIKQVLESGCLAGTCENFVRRLEMQLGKFTGIKHVIAVSSGTAALHVAYRAVGVGPGKPVAVPGFTFVATASAVLHCNSIPIFVDIDRETLFIDLADLEKKIKKYNIEHVCVVHIGGIPGPVDEVAKLCEDNNIVLIEDCAQALGATYLGNHVGKFGKVATFSFYPTKTITTGEGGAVATDDEDVALTVRRLINHGEERRYYYVELGYNYRMSEILAAIGVAEMEIVHTLVENRRRFAKVFIEEVEQKVGNLVDFQKVPKGAMPAWNLIQIMLNVEKLGKSRDFVLQKLRENGLHIFTVAYPMPLPDTPLFRNMRGLSDNCPWRCPLSKVKLDPDVFELPNCRWVCERVLTLLVSPTFTEEDAVKIADTFCRVLQELTS